MIGVCADRHRAGIGGSASLAIGMVVIGCIVSGCACSHKPRSHPTETGGAASLMNPASVDEILSLSGLGTFEGRCQRGARSWTLRFVVRSDAADTVSYQVGSEARRTVNADPGHAVAIRLVPDATRTYEPADRFFPPAGQGRGLSSATWVPTTAPLAALIYQGTEPQTLLADVHLALATIGGESGQCALVGSRVDSYAYSNG